MGKDGYSELAEVLTEMAAMKGARKTLEDRVLAVPRNEEERSPSRPELTSALGGGWDRLSISGDNHFEAELPLKEAVDPLR